MVKMPRTVYELWTGTNEMSNDRKEALSTNNNIHADVRLLYPDDIMHMEVEGHPIHPGYKYLTTNHRSDYLRSYILHFYGGGYTDIKHYNPDNNWEECFDYMDSNPEVEIIGTPEIPRGSSIPSYNTPEITKKLIGNGFFVCRPNTRFSLEWYTRVNSYMDSIYDKLREYGVHEDVSNLGPKHMPAGYPIPYFGLQGDIFHPLIVETYDENPNRVSNMLIVGLEHKRYR